MAPFGHRSRREAAANRAAADWLARRDRGLTPAEQDEYLEWLRQDPSHSRLIARHEATLRRMARLPFWQPALSSAPNPELFARPRRPRRRTLLAVAAALVVLAAGIFAWGPEREPSARRTAGATWVRENEKRVLSDGTVVELRDGSRIEVAYSEAERRVRLTGGEAHFSVAKNPARPFVVEAGGVAVRAIGTEFVVRLDAAAVNVLVTEGSVRVEHEAAAAPAGGYEPPVVAASHRAVVSRDAGLPVPEVSPVTPAEIRDVLAWQAARFQFDETPLLEAVAEFNRRNAQKMVIGEPALERVPIGGIFRVDNVDGFVSLLAMTLGVKAERRESGEIVLGRGR